MATSPSHKWGQIIGQEFLEVAVEPLMREVAVKHQLYLDIKGPRPARPGKKISWIDLYGNTHDLDFVLERGGSDDTIGMPVAFIETAWRRYTKHSRNKAQEIQGAVLPLAAKHRAHAPFIGVILAGEFTQGALAQLKSLGFRVLHFPYSTIITAFQSVGIDADFGEDTPDAVCKLKVKAWQRLSAEQRTMLGDTLRKMTAADIAVFMLELENAIQRQVGSIRVLPLHGTAFEWDTIAGAIGFVDGYDETTPTGHPPFIRYEIVIVFNNKDRITGEFANKKDAVAFMQSYDPGFQPVAKP
jgi:hypothetical protein